MKIDERSFGSENIEEDKKITINKRSLKEYRNKHYAPIESEKGSGQ